MGVLPRPGDVVMIDAATYPIAKRATLLAEVRGATVLVYPHHRPDYPQLQAGRRLLLVTDGWCHGCGRPAPLPRLQRMACDTVGLVVVDDSQAFGVLGRRHAGDPFGDGSGTPRWSGVDHSHVRAVGGLHGQGLRRSAGGDHRRSGDRRPSCTRGRQSPPQQPAVRGRSRCRRGCFERLRVHTCATSPAVHTRARSASESATGGAVPQRARPSPWWECASSTQGVPCSGGPRCATCVSTRWCSGRAVSPARC